MIRAERIDGMVDVQIRKDKDDDILEEYMLITAVLMNEVPAHVLLGMVKEAVERRDIVKDLNDKAKRIFNLRLSHLLELNSLTLDELIAQESFSQKDIEDLKEGTIPSIEGVKILEKRFGVHSKYFFGADK